MSRAALAANVEELLWYLSMDELQRTFKIEKGIPVRPTTRHRRYRWPFGEMKVGDSFGDGEVHPGTVRSAIAAWTKATKSQSVFQVSKIDKGMRCWRIK